MLKIKCYSVRLKGLTKISPKCYEGESFDGSKDLLPASCVFLPDFSVSKSDAYWIAAWILPLKKIQWSSKKVAWFDPETRQMRPHIEIKKHTPKRIESTETKPNDDLIR